MDTEEFLVLAEEIAKEHPEDETALRFLKICNQSITDERECLSCAGQVMMKFAS
jgi:hypothetical protein